MTTPPPDPVAVITGAAQGIGAAIAEKLERQGMQVARWDIRFDNDYANHRYCVDVRQRESVDAACESVEETLGPVTHLAHAAGVLRLDKVLEIKEADWRDTLDVNLTGTLNVCRTVTTRMQKRQNGAVVVVSSNAAHTPRTGMGAYAASKAAITQLVKCLGLELAPFGVRCNLVAPGSTDTPMQRQLWNDDTGAERVIAGSLEDYRLGIPLGRIATPDQVAAMAAFLLSDEAGQVTMEQVTVDGGATLGIG